MLAQLRKQVVGAHDARLRRAQRHLGAAREAHRLDHARRDALLGGEAREVDAAVGARHAGGQEGVPQLPPQRLRRQGEGEFVGEPQLAHAHVSGRGAAALVGLRQDEHGLRERVGEELDLLRELAGALVVIKEALRFVEDDGGAHLPRLLERLLHLALRVASVHQRGGVGDAEGQAALERDRLGGERLTGAARAVQQHDGVLLVPVALVESPLRVERVARLGEFHDLLELLERLRGQHDVLEAAARRDIRRLVLVREGGGVGGLEEAAHLRLGAVHEVVHRHRRLVAVLARHGGGERGEHGVLDEAAAELVVEGDGVDAHVVGDLELVGQVRAPDALAHLVVGQGELDHQGDAAVHRLVDRLRPVRREDHDAVVALKLREDGREHRVAVARLEDGLALIKEDDGVGELRLAEDEAHHVAALRGAQLPEVLDVDRQDLLAEVLRHRVGEHRLAGAARTVEQEDQTAAARTLPEGVAEADLALAARQQRVVADGGDDSLLRRVGEHDLAERDGRGVHLGPLDHLGGLRLEAHQVVDDAAVDVDHVVAQVGVEARPRGARRRDGDEAVLEQRRRRVEALAALDTVLEAAEEHEEDVPDRELALPVAAHHVPPVDRDEDVVRHDVTDEQQQDVLLGVRESEPLCEGLGARPPGLLLRLREPRHHRRPEDALAPLQLSQGRLSLVLGIVVVVILVLDVGLRVALLDDRREPLEAVVHVRHVVLVRRARLLLLRRRVPHGGAWVARRLALEAVAVAVAVAVQGGRDGGVDGLLCGVVRAVVGRAVAVGVGRAFRGGLGHARGDFGKNLVARREPAARGLPVATLLRAWGQFCGRHGGGTVRGLADDVAQGGLLELDQLLVGQRGAAERRDHLGRHLETRLAEGVLEVGLRDGDDALLHVRPVVLHELDQLARRHAHGTGDRVGGERDALGRRRRRADVLHVDMQQRGRLLA
mmetsp:Transcript_50745/g.156643  ORF Transcript_50745/g.156643 Transcript_50745/m.156643 type:complete len:945 (-) Transcript_50745:605-3439(-)